MRDAVIREWRTRVERRWPADGEQSSRRFTHMILRGSRMTSAGLKISYHVIYPFLVFPSNTTMLHDEVGSMSVLPQFQYRSSKTGGLKSFIDPGVYTNNRQFRLLLCTKLSDCTMTALHLSSPPTISQFVRSCITHLDETAWRVPPDVLPRAVSGPSSGCKQRHSKRTDKVRLVPQALTPLCTFLYHLLCTQGQPRGQLIPTGDPQHGLRFRWEVTAGTLRPCMTAQIWRPSQAGHYNNGAWVMIDSQGAVYLCCLHPQCTMRGYSNKRLLGQIPLRLMHLINMEGVSRTCGQRESTQDSQQSHIISGLGTEIAGPTKSATAKHTCEHEATDKTDHEGMAEVLQSKAVDCGSEEVSQDCELQTETSPNSGTPCGRQHRDRQLSRDQSSALVTRENQAEKEVSFCAWTVETGSWGGRVSGTGEAVDPVVELRPEALQEISPLEWVECSVQSPFVASPPASLFHSVCTLLANDNTGPAQDHARTRGSEPQAQPSLVKPIGDDRTGNGAQPSWTIGPSLEWLQMPIGSRFNIGSDLVDRAIASYGGLGLACPSKQYHMDTWSCPFLVSYLNVGYRHLVGSLQEIVELVLVQRPDILFLGDLVTTRNQMGRLKQRLEAALNGEWFVTTNISASPGRPVGIGAVIHCSLASHMTDCIIPHSGGSDRVAAIEGRILDIKISRPESPHTWHFIGVYQHVARSENKLARIRLRESLQNIIQQAREDRHQVVILGDFNAAPPNGRWGYSRWSTVFKEDGLMEDWVRSLALTEISHPIRPRPTWKSSAGMQTAILDRIFVSLADSRSMELSVYWCQPLIVFDHALLLLRIHQSLVGSGYAGACRPDRVIPSRPRCQVDLKKWKQYLPLWQRLLSSGLQHMEEEQTASPPDPFEALKQGELLADSLARALARKYIPKPGDVRRAYSFAGNRLLFRELNYLGKARAIVRKILRRDAELLTCLHWFTRWTVVMARLHHLVCRSGHPVPTPLARASHVYFQPGARGELQSLLESVTAAVAVRKAAVQELYSQARFTNLQNLRKQRKEAGGVLDKRTIQAALGKIQPRQRMWALSGTVFLGVRMLISAERQMELLVLLKSAEGVDDIAHLSGCSQGLTLWFTGPRKAGDFISRWCANAGSEGYISILPLKPPGQYVAIRPDDILAVQEWHTASEGMDSYSICPQCRESGLYVLTTTGSAQRFGNSMRAVRYFCWHCQSLHNEPDSPPLSQCPIPPEVLADMRKIPGGTKPLLNRPIDFETLEIIGWRHGYNLKASRRALTAILGSLVSLVQ